MTLWGCSFLYIFTRVTDDVTGHILECVVQFWGRKAWLASWFYHRSQSQNHFLTDLRANLVQVPTWVI